MTSIGHVDVPLDAREERGLMIKRVAVIKFDDDFDMSVLEAAGADSSEAGSSSR